MNGLELLEPRVFKDKVNIESIEQKFAIKIPTAFKVFIESFQLKDDLVRDKAFYYYPKPRGAEITFPTKKQ